MMLSQDSGQKDYSYIYLQNTLTMRKLMQLKLNGCDKETRLLACRIDIKHEKFYFRKIIFLRNLRDKCN